MPTIRKTADGWEATGDTVEELLIGARAIEQFLGAAPKRIVQKSTRREQIRQFLAEHGPMRRRDIALKSGIPTGTLNTLLNPDEFQQTPDGRWTADVPQTQSDGAV